MNRMLPIKGASRAKRLRWSAEQNIVSWAYMKELRENNRTRRVYDVDPYAEVYQFRENVFGIFNQNCDGMGDVWEYLIIGPEKAMLIDTAYGLGDIPGLVDEITGEMPLIVVNTHVGPDHVLGNCRFDRVYCHEAEVENIRRKCTPEAWDYLFDADGKNIWLEFDKEDLPKYRDYELIGVPDHTIFNLGGGHQVELIWTAGHQPGHAMYLDKTTRCLFAGDDVCSDVIGCGGGPQPNMVNGQYANITAYRDRLAKLCERLDEFDAIFPGHFMVDLDSFLLLDILDTLNAIIRDPEGYDYKVEHTKADGTKVTRMHKFVRGFGTVAYTANGVYYPEGFEKK